MTTARTSASTRARPRRPAARPVHRRARDADLPDHELRVRGRRVGGRLLQPAGVRQHLLADHEPDRGRFRGARRAASRAASARSPSPAASPRRRRRSSRCSQPGDHSSPRSALYGGTVTQLKHLPRKLGVELTFVDPRRPRRLARGAADRRPSCCTARRSATRAATCSTSRRSPTIAHEHGAPLMIDNTFATPYLCRPIEFGADIVVHSATKFIGGHGTSIGGVVVDCGHVRLVERPLPDRRRPLARLPRPRVPRDVRHVRLPDEAARRVAARPRRVPQPVQRVPLPARAGDAAAAHGAARRERARRRATSSSSTRRRARALRGARVDSPLPPLVERYLPRGAGAVFAFDLDGGREAGQRFIESLRSGATWPTSATRSRSSSTPPVTTHRQLSDEELSAPASAPGTIRLSVGLETSTT